MYLNLQKRKQFSIAQNCPFLFDDHFTQFPIILLFVMEAVF